ncbi:MAG: hypothetical protein JWR07_2874, partial [Nevskia sp.]|nr:hypothetical protein [Nevskia sp.]
DPASFVKDNLQTIRNSGAWRKFVAAAKARTPGMSPEPEEAEAPAPKKRARARGAAVKSRSRAAAKGRKQQAAGPAEAPAADETND